VVGFRAHDAGHGDNCCLGGAGAEADDHVASGSVDGKVHSKSSCQRLRDDVDFPTASAQTGFHHRAFFNAGDPVRGRYKQAGLEEESRTSDFFDQFAKVNLGELVFSNDTVAKRANDLDRFRNTPHHAEGGGA